jgi:hypothetical protein
MVAGRRKPPDTERPKDKHPAPWRGSGFAPQGLIKDGMGARSPGVVTPANGRHPAGVNPNSVKDEVKVKGRGCIG